MTILVLLFIAGYTAIAFENILKINKTAVALALGVLCWVVLGGISGDPEWLGLALKGHLGGIAEIILFLIGAMTIVELIDSHGGFELIAEKISAGSQRSLLWIIAVISFFLSAVLDNLTTAIVMISLVQRVLPAVKDRKWYAVVIIVSANAGGAWSPIGDVTTTMLWIGGQLTAGNIVRKLFLPSLISTIIPLLYITSRLKGRLKPVAIHRLPGSAIRKRLVLFTGLGILLLVPLFKTVFHLPPYMGMLLGLALIWIVIELFARGKAEEEGHPISKIIQRIDLPSVLFFTGILLAVSALESAQVLSRTAELLDLYVGNRSVIVIILGMLSSVVDNVPLVAATMGMYSLAIFPTDHYIWELIAYCCGTGGSILVIGSAAGVAVMGLEKLDFLWYVRRASFVILLGFLAGALFYVLMPGNMQ